MCGKFVTLGDKTWGELLDLLRLPSWTEAPDAGVAVPGTPQAAVFAPFDGAPIKPDMARWGWYKKAKEKTGAQFNTRAETLLSYYPKQAEAQRALIPMSGFIEGAPSKGNVHLFEVGSAPILVAAAIWKTQKDGTRAFSILTTHADATVRPHHHRMPLTFDVATGRAWLDGDWESLLQTPLSFDRVTQPEAVTSKQASSK